MIAGKYDEVSAEAEDCMAQVGGFLNRGTQQISDMIEDRPARFLMVSCLAGFGVGLLLSRLLASESPSHSTFDRGTAERFGRQLLDKVERAMPTMLRERIMK